MTPPEEQPRSHRTLSDVYAERPLTSAQVRRLVALLRLTEQPAKGASDVNAEAA
ncbi:hypothetical protein ACIRRI_06930 [Streptomyces mirabilis]|uniref:hypothetical protein n=1 Tax=Streptomyces mirabilis TaxID=68239 RepID=UPI0038303F2D